MYSKLPILCSSFRLTCTVAVCIPELLVYAAERYAVIPIFETIMSKSLAGMTSRMSRSTWAMY